MRARGALFAFVALAMWAVKRHYASAGADQLDWILRPTAHLVAAFTGASFERVTGEGYLCRERFFVIEKACAGVNFLLAASATVAFVLSRRARSFGSAARVLGTSFALGYAAAVLVNAVRISVALWLAAHPIAVGLVTAAQLHRIEGIVVYFGGLLVVHEIAMVLAGQRAGSFRPWIPLVCYAAITIAVPIANGAWRSGATFFEHALLVAAVPCVLIALGWSASRGSRVVLDQLLRKHLPEGRSFALVLDVARPRPGPDESDVRHPAAHAPVARVRVDAELGGGRVRCFADDVGGTGVAENGEKKLSIVNHGDHIAPVGRV